jgi:hypothetical protein
MTATVASPKERTTLPDGRPLLEETSVSKRRIIIAIPPLLIVTMYGAFRFLTAWLGIPSGYLVAFAVYWIFWCILVPTSLLGLHSTFNLFRESKLPFNRLGATTHVLLWWPVVVPFAYSFLPRIGSAPFFVAIASLVLGIVIGVTEELLWRGLFVATFPNQPSLNSLYPAISFGVWHLCPLSVLPSRYPGGAMSFTAYSVALGLSYAFYARQTGSIRWCTVSHCIHDALGLGAFPYAKWLT